MPDTTVHPNPLHLPVDGVQTIKDTKTLIARLEQIGVAADSPRAAAYGVGLVRTSQDGSVLSVRFPAINVNNHHGVAALLSNEVGFFTNTGAREIPLWGINNVLLALKPFEDDGDPHPNIDALKSIRQALLAGSEAEGSLKAVVVYICHLSDAITSTEDAFLRLRLLAAEEIRAGDPAMNDILSFLPASSWSSEEPLRREDALSILDELTPPRAS